jgi:hypothetical protein
VADQGTYPSYQDGSVSVLLGKGDGTFLPALTFPAGAGRRSVAVGDFNGDGKLDLAVAGFGYAYTYPYGWTPTVGDVRVLLGNGDGTFQPAQSLPAGINPASVAVGDFNGDGKPDLAVANIGYSFQGSVSLLLGKGDGTFQAALTFPAGSEPVSVAVGDFNGDGIPDLAVANQGDFPSYYVNDGSVSLLLGKGDGTFQTAVNYPAGRRPWFVAVGDFNGDGVPDLAVVSPETVRVLLGKGNGTFQTTNVSYVAGSEPVSVAVGDFNGDGFPDLAVANSYSSDVSILLNDATWAGGPSRARGSPSRPLVPKPLPPPAVLHLPPGEEPPWAGSALLAVGPPPGTRPAIEPLAPLSLPGADPPPPLILAALLGEGRPFALADSRGGPLARGAPWTLDQLFAELAVNGLWDDRTDGGIPLLT